MEMFAGLGLLAMIVIFMMIPIVLIIGFSLLFWLVIIPAIKGRSSSAVAPPRRVPPHNK